MGRSQNINSLYQPAKPGKTCAVSRKTSILGPCRPEQWMLLSVSIWQTDLRHLDEKMPLWMMNKVMSLRTGTLREQLANKTCVDLFKQMQM
jgi:hypothetical protein